MPLRSLEPVDFEPAPGARIGLGKARSLGEEVIAIYDRCGDARPETIQKEVNAGRAPMFRAELTWNDKEAAETHRREQIRKLLQKVYVILQDKKDPKAREIRARLAVYVILPANPNRGRPRPLTTWTISSKALSDEEMTDAIVREFREYAAAMLRRFKDWEEAREVVEAIERTLARLAQKGRKPAAEAPTKN